MGKYLILWEVMPSKQKAIQRQEILFCRQFSTMVDAGLPIIQCLQILSSEEEDAPFKAVLEDMLSSVKGGETFTQALRKHPKLFDSGFVSMVEAGEAGGVLETTMRQLAMHIETRAKLASQLRAYLTYPIAMAVTAILTAYVAVNLSPFLADNVFYVIGSLVIFALALWAFPKAMKGREAWDQWVLRFPVYGALLKKARIAGFARMMGTMLSSGVAILDALQISAKAVKNLAIENAISAARTGIAEGGTMANSLAGARVIPKMVCQLVATGESTGALDSTLIKIADYYDAEVELAIENTKLLMLLFGIVLCGVVFGTATYYLKVVG